MGTRGGEAQDTERESLTETREISPILGTVFKLQRRRNHIKEMLQKREEAHPDQSRAVSVSLPHSAHEYAPHFCHDL